VLLNKVLAQRYGWSWSHPSFSYHKYKDGLFQPCRVRVHHHLLYRAWNRILPPAWPAFLECRIAGIIFRQAYALKASLRHRTVHFGSWWSKQFTSIQLESPDCLHLGPCPGIDALLLFTKDMLGNDPAMMSLYTASKPWKNKTSFTHSAICRAASYAWLRLFMHIVEGINDLGN
jgi:hypothetical protein